MPDADEDLCKIKQIAGRRNKKDEIIAELESRLISSKDKRGHERFYFTLVVLIIVDVLSFKGMSASGIWAIFILELLFIIFWAAECGVEGVTYTLERLFAWTRGKSVDGNDENSP